MAVAVEIFFKNMISEKKACKALMQQKYLVLFINKTARDSF